VHRRKGRRRAVGERAPIGLPAAPNQRWSLDFLADQLGNGRRFRILAVIDDFSRECLAAVVDTSLPGMRVVRELDRLVALRGGPAAMVSDNRPPEGGRSDLRSRRGQQAAEGLRTDRQRVAAPGAGAWRGLALHPARQADAERPGGEFQWPAARRMPERACLCQPCRGASADQGVACGLQHDPAAWAARATAAGALCRTVRSIRQATA